MVSTDTVWTPRRSHLFIFRVEYLTRILSCETLSECRTITRWVNIGIRYSSIQIALIYVVNTPVCSWYKKKFEFVSLWTIGHKINYDEVPGWQPHVKKINEKKKVKDWLKRETHFGAILPVIETKTLSIKLFAQSYPWPMKKIQEKIKFECHRFGYTTEYTIIWLWLIKCNVTISVNVGKQSTLNLVVNKRNQLN